MPYTVQLIGLMCFQEFSQGCRALLPDGRFPENRSISPHIASISVRNTDLLSYQGWNDVQVCADSFETEFVFPPSTIDLSFSRSNARYDAARLLSRLPSLRKIDENFRIDHDTANWAASIEIPQGELEALRLPGLPNPPLIGELRVDHDDEITVVVTSRKGWPRRHILLKPRSELAIVNTSRGLPPRTDALDHFILYEELSAAPVRLHAPPELDTSDVAESKSRHPSLRAARPATHVEVSCIGATER